MKRPRAHIPLPEKLAAALCLLLAKEERDLLRAAKVPAKDVIEMFDFDHVILHALGGSDEWHNLTPMLRPEHREKSRRDTAIVAKVKRVARARQELTAVFLAKIGQGERPPKRASRWPKGRKLQSRNSFQERR